MRVLVMGGDGFVGWPVSLRLSNAGNDVTIVDNFFRRQADFELGVESLTPIKLLADRVSCWKKLTGKKLNYKRLDVSRNYYGLVDLMRKLKPEVIIHLAEQRAAPYSMKSEIHKRYTVNNNINATHNILCAIVETDMDVHLVHIGTAGVYGYNDSSVTIPEGYLDYHVKNGSDYIKMRDLFPMRPGSIYHMTKTMDSMMFRFYAQNNGIRITDLHQGVIWGINTPETETSEDLFNRFDYCGDYGTVLNRFLMQSAINHPITVYGLGEQTRAFIHIVNTCDCIEIAVANPPSNFDEVLIFNQTTEQLRLIDLANMVKELTGVEIQHCSNPRVEPEKNSLVMDNAKFLSLGLNPIKVDEKQLSGILRLADKYKDRIKREKIYCTSVWRSDLKCEPIQLS